MVCSSNPVFEDFSNLSRHGMLHIQQNKSPPLDKAPLKSILRNPEKLSWSQTKALKMSGAGSSWDYQRKSWANQRHQQFATLLDDEFLPPEDDLTQCDVNVNAKREVKIAEYNSKKESSTNIHNIPKVAVSRNKEGSTSVHNIPKVEVSRNIPKVEVSRNIPMIDISRNIPMVEVSRNAIVASNMIQYQNNMIKYQNMQYNNTNLQNIPYNNTNLQKLQYEYNNAYSNNNSFQPKNCFQPKTVTFQETVTYAKPENKNSEYTYNNQANVYNEPVYSNPNIEMNNQITKMHLAEHLRAKRISEAIKAAAQSSTSSRLPQASTYDMNKDKTSDYSNWSISQKLDHKTHKIMPLTLKLKKSTKIKDKNKRPSRCNKKAVCPLNCIACKNSHTDTAKKKQIHSDDQMQPKSKKLKEDKQIEFLELPEDGNYLIVRKVVEECPMCYTKLDIRNCVVNISLLLYTYYCQCGLTIFHIPHTPKNIPQPVKIIET